ncbi:MAG TPA: CARDB domain-containing protein [Gallionellaceae bacterium]
MKNAKVARCLIAAALLALAGCGGGGAGSGTTAGTTSPTTGTALPDLAITSFSAPSAGTVGGLYTATVTVTNLGTAVAAGTSAIFALSPTSDITSDYYMLNLGLGAAVLSPGQSTTITVTFNNLPSNAPNGTYYIGAIIPYGPELSKANNITAQPFTLSGGSTCTNDGFEPDNSAGAAKAIVLGQPQAHNHCDGTSDWLSFNATSGSTYTLSTSQVNSGTWTQIILYDTDGITPIANGGSGLNSVYESRLQWTASKTGTFYARVVPVFGLMNAGPNTGYNMNLGDVRPDLIVTGLYTLGNGVQGGQVNVSATVFNQGFAAVATASSYDVGYYLSPTATFNVATAIALGTQTFTGGLPVGSTSPYVTQAVTIPAATAVGNYFLFAVVNPAGTLNPVSEYATVNNVSAGQPFSVISASCTDDIYEPDNSFGAAKVITVGAAPQAHKHCLDMTDWVMFSATAGTSYSIMVNKVGGSANPTVQLYDTTGATLLLPAAGTTATSINWTAPATGTYYILASDGMGAGTDYTIAVNLLLPDLTDSMVTQTTTTVTAGGFLDITDTVSNTGYLAAGPFTVGTYFSATTSVSAANTLAASRSVTGLLAPPNYPSSNQAWYSAHFAYTTPPGTYYLATIADSTNAVTEVTKTNNTSTPIAITVVAPPCAVDAYEDDDDPTTAKAIAAGATQARNSCDDGIDWVTFTPAVTGVYVAFTGAFGPSLAVLNSDAVTPVTPQDSYYTQQYSWNATAGTKYYFKITNNFPGSGTAYNLTAYQCVQDAYEEDDVPAAAKPIVVGAAAQTHNLCDDGRDWVTFNATAGTKYTITATNVGAASNVKVTLYDATGTTIQAFGSAAQGGKTNVISWTAPATGTYAVQATPSTQLWGANTDYTLQLQ